MKKILKLLAIVGVLIVLMMGGCFFYLAPHPPKEAALIQNFQDHRAEFEKLRNMLQADAQLRRVADWGVEINQPFFLGMPSDSVFPTARYLQYLALLKEANARLAARDIGTNAELSIIVWGWGWAGDTQHIGVSWLNEAPTNQVTSFDDYRAPHDDSNRRVGYRHIDQNWYLWTDR